MYYEQGGDMQIKKYTKLCVKLDDINKLEVLCQNYKISKQAIYDLNGGRVLEYQPILLPAPAEKIYIVKPLDTIEKIANALNVDTNTVFCATCGKIFVGQKIIL